MTDEEKQAYRKKLFEQFKIYNHIDYDDDEEIIELIIDTVIEEMMELIDGFDPYRMTSRQRLLVLISVKEFYDNREKYKDGNKNTTMRNAVSSMLLKEMYGGGRSDRPD